MHKQLKEVCSMLDTCGINLLSNMLPLYLDKHNLVIELGDEYLIVSNVVIIGTSMWYVNHNHDMCSLSLINKVESDKVIGFVDKDVTEDGLIYEYLEEWGYDTKGMSIVFI